MFFGNLRSATAVLGEDVHNSKTLAIKSHHIIIGPRAVPLRTLRCTHKAQGNDTVYVICSDAILIIQFYTSSIAERFDAEVKAKAEAAKAAEFDV